MVVFQTQGDTDTVDFPGVAFYERSMFKRGKVFLQGVPHPRAEKSLGSFLVGPVAVAASMECAAGLGFCWDKLFPSLGWDLSGWFLGSAQVEVLLQEEFCPSGNSSTRVGHGPGSPAGLKGA